jgi:hypothetical protein
MSAASIVSVAQTAACRSVLQATGPGGSGGKRPASLRAGGSPATAASGSSGMNAAVIEEVTDAASSLLSVEADVFDQRREEMEHIVRMADLAAPALADGGAGTVLPLSPPYCICQHCVKALANDTLVWPVAGGSGNSGR